MWAARRESIIITSQKSEMGYREKFVLLSQRAEPIKRERREGFFSNPTALLSGFLT